MNWTPASGRRCPVPQARVLAGLRDLWAIWHCGSPGAILGLPLCPAAQGTNSSALHLPLPAHPTEPSFCCLFRRPGQRRRASDGQVLANRHTPTALEPTSHLRPGPRRSGAGKATGAPAAEWDVAPSPPPHRCPFPFGLFYAARALFFTKYPYILKEVMLLVGDS